MSTYTKKLVGVIFAGLAALSLATGAALAQEAEQPSSAGCSCCRNMQPTEPMQPMG